MGNLQGYPIRNQIQLTMPEPSTRQDLILAGYRPSVQPSITLIAPNGSELWQRGRTYNLKWTSSNLSENVISELYRGGNFDSMVSSNAPNNGRYPWPLPLSQSLGSNFSVKIKSMSAPEIYDISDNNFSITEISKASPWIPLLLLEDWRHELKSIPPFWNWRHHR